MGGQRKNFVEAVGTDAKPKDNGGAPKVSEEIHTSYTAVLIRHERCITAKNIYYGRHYITTKVDCYVSRKETGN